MRSEASVSGVESGDRSAYAQQEHHVPPHKPKDLVGGVKSLRDRCAELFKMRAQSGAGTLTVQFRERSTSPAGFPNWPPTATWAAPNGNASMTPASGSSLKWGGSRLRIPTKRQRRRTLRSTVRLDAVAEILHRNAELFPERPAGGEHREHDHSSGHSHSSFQFDWRNDHVGIAALGRLLAGAQALLQASPFILTGLVVAGVFRRLFTHEELRKLFGHGTWRALPQAWAIGMLLPICSLGAIPVVRQMRRAGLSGGTILAFALSAPLFNPLSLLYGLTLSEPGTIIAFALCTLVVVTFVGLIWDRLFPQSSVPEESPPGIRRMAAVALVGVREVAGPALPYLLAGLFGVVLLSWVLPAGSLQRAMGHGNPWAPLLMAAVALPAYATPMMAMSQLGSMFQHGNSVGAAFTLLTLGAGTNLGLVWWMHRSYGLGKAGRLVGASVGDHSWPVVRRRKAPVSGGDRAG